MRVPVPRNVHYNLRNRREFYNTNVRTLRYANSFYPYCISEWAKLSEEIKNSPSISIFKQKLLAFIRPLPNLSFSIDDIYGIKLITMLRVEFSDLRLHRVFITILIVQVLLVAVFLKMKLLLTTYCVVRFISFIEISYLDLSLNSLILSSKFFLLIIKPEFFYMGAVHLILSPTNQY